MFSFGGNIALLFIESKTVSKEKIETPKENPAPVAAKKSIFAYWNGAMQQMLVLKGRDSRYSFWSFMSVSLVIFLLTVFCGKILGETKLVMNIFALYFLFPATSITVRRLHDLSLSGWWCLPMIAVALAFFGLWDFGYKAWLEYLVFITLGYGSFLCWILCGRGIPADNKYGGVIEEAAESNLDSRALMCFMAAFIIGLWLIFLTHIW